MVKTVKDFVRDAESLQNIKSDVGKSLKEAMMDAAYIWSNDACVGYCLKAMKAIGIDAVSRSLVRDTLYAFFEFVSIQDADEWGRRGTTETEETEQQETRNTNKEEKEV